MPIVMALPITAASISDTNFFIFVCLLLITTGYTCKT
jgi:hypothetical protein